MTGESINRPTRSRLWRSVRRTDGHVLVCLILAAVGTEVFVTYARLPASELYHVSGSGLAGGASRALVFLNFPTALIAIAIVAIVFQQLPGAAVQSAAVVAALLCVPVFWPGVVSQANLDARPINALAGIGAGCVLALTVVAARHLPRVGRLRGDGTRLALAVAALLTAPPWIAADLGFYLDGVPLLGWIYQTGAHRPSQPGLPALAPAVHHGHHHGMDGVLLSLSALVLSRRLGAVTGGLRPLTAAYLSLMFVYGLGNIANDFWLEQVLKRGWASWVIPNVLEPRADWAWAVIVSAAGLIWLAWLRTESRPA